MLLRLGSLRVVPQDDEEEHANDVRFHRIPAQ